MSSYSHYEILECDRESSLEEIKKNYRKLVLKYHPDKLTSLSDNSEKFQQIEEAWRVLREPELRKKYDAECRQAELESESFLIYARITADEMEVSNEDEMLSYKCRCGSYYLASKDEFVEKNCTFHIPCSECTFVLVVET